MFPNGGIAPGLQVGNASLNSVSDARRSLRSEFDLAVSRKTCLAIARQVEDVPERRYCAWLAGWKRVTEFCLGCKTQLAASNFFPQDVQIRGVVCGERDHDELVV